MFRHTFASLAFTTLCLAAGQAGAEPAGLLPALPYAGQPGQQPSRVALAWLAPVLGEGITPASRQLLLDARSAEGEDPRQVTITVTQSGLLTTACATSATSSCSAARPITGRSTAACASTAAAGRPTACGAPRPAPDLPGFFDCGLRRSI